MTTIIVGKRIAITGLEEDEAKAWARLARQPNPEKAKLERLGKWAGNVDDFIKLGYVRPTKDGPMVVLPRGMLGQVWETFGQEATWDVRVASRDTVVEMGGTPVQLREYQRKALDPWWPSSWALPGLPVDGMIHAPCGSGKTEMGIALIQRLSARALVIVHTKDLQRQWAERLDKYGITSNLIGGGSKSARIVGEEPVTVGMVQSLRNRSEELDANAGAFGLVVVDECFPAGTMVSTPNGQRPIEQIRAGDDVIAFDESRLSVYTCRVSHTMRRMSSKMVAVISGTMRVVCTSSHPFYVNGHGWKRAGDLMAGDDLAVYSEASNDPLHGVRIRDTEHDKPEEGATQAQGPSLLQAGMRKGRAREGVVGGAVKDEQEVRIGKDEKKQPDVACRCSGKDDSDEARPGMACICGEGRQRKGADCGAVRACNKAVIADGGRNQDRQAARQRVPSRVQGRHCGRIVDGSGGGGRKEPHVYVSTGARREEGCDVGFARVDSVEVLEQRHHFGSGGSGPSCRVYNIEVQGLHTYIANGFVVHNCHHAPASTFADVIQRLRSGARLGLTATPKREDGLQPSLEMVMGPIRSRVSGDDLESCGVRVGFTVRRIDTGWCPQEDPQSGFSAAITEMVQDEGRNALIVKEVQRIVSEGYTALVLTSRVAHAEALADGLGCPALTSGTKDADRKAILDGMRSGEVKVATATQLADEGLDVGIIGAVIMAAPSRAQGKAEQRVGRALRPMEGKPAPVVVDFVDDHFVYLNQWRSRLTAYKRAGMTG